MFDKPLRGRTRPVAPPLTEREAATVARFDNAPDADEALRERVAVALDLADRNGCSWVEMADAAIYVMRGDQP